MWGCSPTRLRLEDHQPLTRLPGIRRAEGLQVAKSTLCGWHEQLAEPMRPLVEAMSATTPSSSHISAWTPPASWCSPKSGVGPVISRVTVAPDKYVLFAYAERHDGAAVDELLGGYPGYLVADAHAVYDHLYRKPGAVIEVGCWAHARRYFFKALESYPERAKAALAEIGASFRD